MADGADEADPVAESSGQARPEQRRRRRVEGGRQHRHEVKVTPEEEARLMALALRFRVSIPKLLVDSAMAGGAVNAATNESVREEVLTELFKAFRLLAGVANNVNQIAKATNVTGEVHAELRATLDAARRTAARVDALIEQLARASQ